MRGAGKPDMPFVAVDWGTSSLRGALIDDAGRVLEERQASRGILSVPPGGFRAVFGALFGDWMAVPGRRCLVSGMAGSQQGWIEAPYCPCPADAAALAARVIAIGPGCIALVPGLSDAHDGVPDVMRGEEVQILGAMRRQDQPLGVDRLGRAGLHRRFPHASRATSFGTASHSVVTAKTRKRAPTTRTMVTAWAR